jgi:hypothetical protein
MFLCFFAELAQKGMAAVLSGGASKPNGYSQVSANVN